ncbi:uncharacterized protein PHACADRAFT_212913 [Phanerochaete carnosa HHB-10118-sp]|uniref:BTB domain-containing protein n=1 Tax=Phanerochaete carnosa (strain HHB-10118-sp) TaxID=650164 RepID=K5VW18_PHACS|nr:uncharacterized protein PHACADRAFT_212913 [Phanerochaete carnosa HHB-10118-sp]EKM51010.1 hypothetical protein PHACADRAFT_212913 [Phanerochaete carnosa HHB-10118-sp]
MDDVCGSSGARLAFWSRPRGTSRRTGQAFYPLSATTVSSPNTEELLAPPPFQGVALADIILRSSDGREYRMCKATLAQASPVFADMFSLPQPQEPGTAGNEWKLGLPVLVLTESAKELDVILQFCIPRTPPALSDFTTVVHVLESARKYQTDWALDSARAALVRLAEDNSVKAYAIAYRYGLENEACEAARFSLRLSLDAVINNETEELRDISAKAFQDLLVYRRSCASAVTNHISSWDWVEACRECMPSAVESSIWVWERNCCGNLVMQTDHTGRGILAKEWWRRYIKNLVEKLKACTWEGTVRSEEALEHYIRYSGGCGICRPTVVGQMAHFTWRTQLEVVRQITETSLVFDSSLE